MAKTSTRVRDLDALERKRVLDNKGVIPSSSKRSDKIRAIADSYRESDEDLEIDFWSEMKSDDEIDPGMTCCEYYYQGCDCDTILIEMMME